MSERNLKDVIFIGGVSEEEKARYYKSSDIYCSPATGGESFGIVLLEAMAASKPVIASNIAGYASVITDGEEGLLHRPKDDEDLACKIEILLKDHEYRLRLASRGRERVEQFRWEHVANNVLEYYKTYLDNSSPALMPNQIPIV
jgi:phosphatidylinositol alpha-mannosyltransferase